MKRFFLGAILALAGCSNVGYRSQGTSMSQGERACRDDCEGKWKLCDSKAGCEKDYSECLKACDRWSGLRSENGGSVSVSVPVGKSKQ
jgi:hypothetical protein